MTATACNAPARIGSAELGREMNRVSDKRTVKLPGSFQEGTYRQLIGLEPDKRGNQRQAPSKSGNLDLVRVFRQHQSEVTAKR